MKKLTSLQNLRTTWQSVNAKVVLALIILVFTGYTIFLATNLQRNIVPDEPFHFRVSEAFSAQWGIPEEVSYMRNMGNYVRRNPFLAYTQRLAACQALLSGTILTTSAREAGFFSYEE